MKAGVIEGDTYCTLLVCYSIYDKKPFNLLTMASEEIKWITKTIDVYYRYNETQLEIYFHCTNLQE